ncbi:hypothetical protein PAMP_023123 [Pampus punctatissimus]
MPPTGQKKRAALCGIWALFFALIVCAVSVDGCPHKCSCSGSHVDCQGLGLKTVPKGIPRNAERLYILGSLSLGNIKMDEIPVLKVMADGKIFAKET